MSGKVWAKTDTSGDGGIKFEKERSENSLQGVFVSNSTRTCEMTGKTLSFFCRVLHYFNSATISEAFRTTAAGYAFNWFGSMMDLITHKVAR